VTGNTGELEYDYTIQHSVSYWDAFHFVVAVFIGAVFNLFVINISNKLFKQ
jgi:hypothetical protein